METSIEILLIDMNLILWDKSRYSSDKICPMWRTTVNNVNNEQNQIEQNIEAQNSQVVMIFQSQCGLEAMHRSEIEAMHLFHI